jgi:hypothetical protein
MNKFIFLLLLPFTLYAQDFTFNTESGKAVPNFVGELKLMKGSALKTTGGRPRAVQIGEKFYPKDVVTTDVDSSMKILIADDTWLALGPQSELVFSEFEFTDKNNRKIHYELKKGQLSANVRQRVKAGEVRFKSRYASMGVRGTKIMMNYREINGQAVSEFALIEGQADVVDARGNSHPLEAGERIILVEDQKNTNHQLEKLKLTPQDLENFASPEGEEDKGIRPFMPYFEPKAMTVTKAPEQNTTSGNKMESDRPGAGSFHNLKKLNEQLQDNQKKRKGP